MEAENESQKTPGFPRRQFISSMVMAGAATAFVSPALAAAVSDNKISTGPAPAALTVDQVIALIRKDIPGDVKDTVDTLKSGHGDQVVSGIVTTMFATADIIEKTAALKANFIIAHEPTFYNHLDNPDFVPGNRIVKEKQALLAKHGITVWRFHDYWHQHQPDGILYGVLKTTGWLEYNKNADHYFQIPPKSLGDIATDLKKKLGIGKLRVIGDLTASCSRIALLPGAAGGDTQISLMESKKPDLLIVGEASEWETPEYFRDARYFGKPVSLIVLGHAMSEEPGMDYLVDWLRPKVPGITITHIATPYAFTWV